MDTIKKLVLLLVTSIAAVFFSACGSGGGDDGPDGPINDIAIGATYILTPTVGDPLPITFTDETNFNEDGWLGTYTYSKNADGKSGIISLRYTTGEERGSTSNITMVFSAPHQGHYSGTFTPRIGSQSNVSGAFRKN